MAHFIGTTIFSSATNVCGYFFALCSYVFSPKFCATFPICTLFSGTGHNIQPLPLFDEHPPPPFEPPPLGGDLKNLTPGVVKLEEMRYTYTNIFVPFLASAQTKSDRLLAYVSLLKAFAADAFLARQTRSIRVELVGVITTICCRVVVNSGGRRHCPLFFRWFGGTAAAMTPNRRSDASGDDCSRGDTSSSPLLVHRLPPDRR